MAESKANVNTAAASKDDFFHGVNLVVFNINFFI